MSFFSDIGDFFSDAGQAIAGAAAIVVGVATQQWWLVGIGVSLELSYFGSKPGDQGQIGGAAEQVSYDPTEGDKLAVGYAWSLGSFVDEFTHDHLPWGGGNEGKNRVKEVIRDLFDFHCDSLVEVWNGTTKLTLGSPATDSTGAPLGYPVNEYISNGHCRLYVRFYNGTWTQTADPHLIAVSDGRWTLADQGIGRCYVRLTYVAAQDNNDQVWAGGDPQLKFVVKGARLYNPAKDSSVGGSGSHRWGDYSTYEWSDNEPLIRYNVARGLYLGNGQLFYGIGCTHDEVRFDDALAAIAIADEDVALKAGGTQKRYRAGGTIEVSTAPRDVMKALADASAGRTATVAGQYRIFVGAYYTPARTFNDDHLLPTFDLEDDPKNPGDSLTNTIYGSYVEKSEGWVTKSLPKRSSSADVTEDGAVGERSQTLNTGFLQDFYQGQRVTEIMRRRARAQISMTRSFVPGLYDVEPGDIIAGTLSRPAFTDKAFYVRNTGVDSNVTVTLSLQEDGPTIYSWDKDTDELPISGGDLPSGDPPADAIPSGVGANPVTLTSSAGRSAPSLRILFNDPQDATVVGFEVEYRVHGSTDSQFARTSDVTLGLLTLPHLISNTLYDYRYRFLTAPGRFGPWSDWAEFTSDDVKIISADLDDHAITAIKFALGIQPVQVVDDLADADAYDGATAVLTTDNKLYTYSDADHAWKVRVDTSDLTGEIVNSQIAAGAVDAANFATGIQPVQLVDTIAHADHTKSSTAFAEDDSKLYRWDGSAWINDVDAADISGTLTGSQIASGTITGSNIANGAITAIKTALAAIDSATGNLVTNAVQAVNISAGAVTAAKTALAAISSTTGALVANSVGTSNIVAGAVTAALIASATITAAQLATGAVGTTQIAANAVTAAKTSLAAIDSSSGNLTANSVTATNIVSGTITSTQIASSTIVASNIAAGAIGTTALAANAVTAGKIAANTITASQIAAGTITGTEIAASTITGAKIAAGTIAAANIAAGAITASKMFIGSTDNLCLDGNCTDASYWNAYSGAEGPLTPQPSSSTTWVSANLYTWVGPGNSGYYCKPVACLPGDSFYFSAVLASGGASSVYLYVMWFNQAGTYSSAVQVGGVSVGGQVSGAVVAPSGTASCALLALCGTGTGQTNYLAAPVIRRMYTGTLIVNGTITASNIAANTITAAQIAAATITGGQIAAGTITASNLAANTITAGQIAAGAIGATQIATGAITASKMFIGSTDNLVLDGNCADASAWVKWNTAEGPISVVAGGGPWKTPNLMTWTGSPGLGYYSRPAACYPGDTFYCSGTMASAGTIALYAIFLDSSSALITATAISSATSGGDRSGTASAPSGSAFVCLLYHVETGSSGTQYMSAPVIRRMYTGSLIVNGTITASNIASNTITATQLAAATITSNELAANSVIAGKIAVGAINATAIIVDNIIVTGKLVSNAVTDSSVATGANTTLGSGFTDILTITKTTTGGPVLVQFNDYCTWTGSGPTLNYQITRDGTVVCQGTSGGGTCPDNLHIGGIGLDTAASAASHTFKLQGKYIGSNAQSRQPALVVTELKK